ncbi:trafficking protein particle complex subunit 2l [Acrasis kona]|uniref:Trafficking protein particle complex subunit 2-like protein n=1 Tax=Acrasis kona TaxID=1008807 RepID=A0AAW2Z4Q4_9EUKA
MNVCCICVVGKSNNPLYLRVFQTLEEEPALKFHYIAHTALDIIEEKVASRKNTTNSADTNLGLLFPTEVYKIYGFITSSKTKIILIGDETEVKDSEVKNFFQKLHKILVDSLSNPFYEYNQQIESPHFEQQVQGLVDNFSSNKSLQKKPSGFKTRNNQSMGSMAFLPTNANI